MDTMAAEHDPRCDELAHPDMFNFVLSLLILVGILLSYLPQHWRIISRRSSDGLSPYFILLGTTSGTCAIANILMLPESRTDVACCAVNSAFSCAAGLLGIAQIGVQWSCFFLIMLLFLIFIPRPGQSRNVRHTHLPADDSAWRDAVIVVSASIVHFAITFIISVIMLARFRHQLGAWANILGALCATLSAVQYLPQLWTTWRRQHIGSLSIPMMCIQTPGAFVFASSLAVRLGTKGWSAWVVYVVTGSLQGVLLAMAIVFERRDRKLAKQGQNGHYDDLSDDPDADVGPHSDAETDPLIENDRLAERQRQRVAEQQQQQRQASNPVHGSKLRPDPVSSSSDSPPDDLLIDRAALEERENQRRSTLADVASTLTAPFRRQPTRWYDARSRQDSGIAVGHEPATSATAADSSKGTPSRRVANETANH